jgi:acetyl-CoA synthetase
MPAPEIDHLLNEGRVFAPSAAWREHAIANDPGVYARAADDPEAFWASFARELEWITPWTSVLEWKPPDARWFVGGQLNVSVNCLDRHARSARRNKAALIWEGEPGDRRVLTYFELHRQVCRFANVLKSLGVTKGDRVALYMPLVPELAMAMLACARIGAVHSVVFGGFSAESLRDRINDAQATVLVTANGGYRRGHIVPLKQMADEALQDTPSIRHVVVHQRSDDHAFHAHMQPGRDLWLHELMDDAPAECPPEPMTPRTCSTSCTRPAPPGNPRALFIRPAVI